MTAVLRIFSYLPNPRVWKALIAADLCGIELEVVGDKPANLSRWLWDYDARALDEAERRDDGPYARRSRRGFTGTLFKTDAFLEAHPFGTVPAAFGPGAFLIPVQAHTRWVEKADGEDNFAPPGPDFTYKREGGQLALLRIPGM